MRWLYALVLVPFVTEVAETGQLPQSPRQWLTEVIAGLVIAGLVRQVRKTHRDVLLLARSDALTGLGNRRAFAEVMEEECARARRSRQPLSLVYIDLDHFKQINDLDGHEQGDLLLQQLAEALRAAVRVGLDRGFRMGGDEFALCLPASTAAESEQVVARIREQCTFMGGAWVAGPLGISVGIAEFDGQETPAAFVRRADAAMYSNKTQRHADR